VAKSAAQLRADIKRRTAANARDRATLRGKPKKKPAAGAKKRATARRATAAKARGRKKAANYYDLHKPYGPKPTRSQVLRSTGSRRNATNYARENSGYNSFAPRAQRRR